jgi:hypothetical protein
VKGLGQRRLAVGMVLVAGAGLLAAQEAAQEYTPAPNPYQGEFVYTVDAELKPLVEVEGVRWQLLRVAPKSADAVRSGQAVAVNILFDLENVRDQTATGVLVVLFEDAQGNRLDRVECEPVQVPTGGARSFRQKAKVQGDVLLATEKVYLFLEVQR